MSRLQSLLWWVLSHCFLSFRPIRKVAFTSIDYSSQGKLRVIVQNKTYLWRKPWRDWWWFSHWSYCFEWWWWWYEYWILMMSLGVAGSQTLASARRCRCCSSDDGRNLTNIGKRNRRFLCWLLADPALSLEEAEAGDGHHLQTQIGTYVQYTSAAWKRTKRADITSLHSRANQPRSGYCTMVTEFSKVISEIAYRKE